MTQHQKQCCKLLYDFLHGTVLDKDISKSTIESAMDTVILYNNIKNKKIKTEEEKEFFNDFLYLNELLLIQLTCDLRQLVLRRKQEVVEFNELFNNCDNSELFRIKAYLKLPFRYSNFQNEMIIFRKYFNMKFDSYYDLLLTLYEYAGSNNKNNMYVSIYSFLNDEKISYSSFIKDVDDNTKYSVCNKNDYKQRSELYKDLESENIQLLSKVYDHKLGQYAEIIVYENEKKFLEKCGRKDLANKVVFVSREIGDGLGYDILSFDPITGEEILIEAKGTVKTKLILDSEKEDNEKNTIDVSYNEMQKMESCNYGNDSKFNKNYYIYIVFFDLHHHPISCQKVQNKDGKLLDQYGNEYGVEMVFKDKLHHFIDKYKVKLYKHGDNLFNL